MAVISVIAAVTSIVVGAGGIAIIICVGLWLRFCHYIYDDAVKRGQTPQAAEVIQAASLGMIGRSSKTPALPAQPKSDDTLLAA